MGKTFAHLVQVAPSTLRALPFIESECQSMRIFKTQGKVAGQPRLSLCLKIFLQAFRFLPKSWTRLSASLASPSINFSNNALALIAAGRSCD